jgi:hypothetical protein
MAASLAPVYRICGLSTTFQREWRVEIANGCPGHRAVSVIFRRIVRGDGFDFFAVVNVERKKGAAIKINGIESTSVFVATKKPAASY